MFQENMDAELYMQIISSFLLPFAAVKYDFNCILHQDNDSKHSSLKCRELLLQNRIIWVKFNFNKSKIQDLVIIYKLKRIKLQLILPISIQLRWSGMS